MLCFSWCPFVCLKRWPCTSKTPKCKRPLGLREQKSRGGYPIDSVPHLPLTSPCPCDPSYIIKNKPTDALAYSLKAQTSPHLLHLLHLLGPSLLSQWLQGPEKACLQPETMNIVTLPSRVSCQPACLEKKNRRRREASTSLHPGNTGASTFQEAFLGGKASLLSLEEVA